MVSGLLLAKMVGARMIDPQRQSVCMLAMAGIHHGAFPDSDTWGDRRAATGELFALGRPDALSIKYTTSVSQLLSIGVKMVLDAKICWRFGERVVLARVCLTLTKTRSLGAGVCV